MTTMRIFATLEELTYLMEGHPHLNLRSLEVEALGNVTLEDGDYDRVVHVSFSMLEEGDWRIRIYSENARLGAKNYGGLAWDEVSQGRLRGFFHRLHPELPRRVDCSDATANIPEAWNQIYDSRNSLEQVKNLVVDLIAEGDEYGMVLVDKLSEVIKAVKEVCAELANVGVRVDYAEAVPVMRLYDTRRQPCDCHQVCVHELNDCSSCEYVGGHTANCSEHPYAPKTKE